VTVSRPSALIFDLDGTLVDSHGSIHASIAAMRAKHGLPEPTPEALEVAVSLPLRAMVARVTGAEDPALIETYASSYLENYVLTMVEKSHPFEGVAEMLDGCVARGFPIAVLTNKTEINARRICEGRFGASRFTTIIGSVPERPNKPDPTGARFAAQQLGVAPDTCWLIGDSRIDVDTARAAGMLAIGVRWGINQELALHIADADVLLDRPDELIGLVDASVS